MWSAKTFAYAYFMAGRYEDTLAMMERLKPENYGTWLWPYRAGALAALGREAEAKAAVKEALTLFPAITIEGTANEPGYSEAEQTRLIPPCGLPASRPVLSPRCWPRSKNRLRLPECAQRPAELQRQSPLVTKLIEHAFFAGFVEVDGELVAIDRGDAAVAEFLVEDAGALRQAQGFLRRGSPFRLR